MFGGACFLLRENMLCVWGKRGFLFVRVDPRACDARQLERWIAMAERYVSGLPAGKRKRRATAAAR